MITSDGHQALFSVQRKEEAVETSGVLRTASTVHWAFTALCPLLDTMCLCCSPYDGICHRRSETHIFTSLVTITYIFSGRSWSKGLFFLPFGTKCGCRIRTKG